MFESTPLSSILVTALDTLLFSSANSFSRNVTSDYWIQELAELLNFSFGQVMWYVALQDFSQKVDYSTQLWQTLLAYFFFHANISKIWSIVNHLNQVFLLTFNTFFAKRYKLFYTKLVSNKTRILWFELTSNKCDAYQIILRLDLVILENGARM